MKKIATFLLCLVSVVKLLADEAIPHQLPNLSVRNEVQIAIDKGLAWLQKNQSADGSWSLNEQPALTALPLTAFMGEPTAKFFRQEPPDFIKKGYAFLMSAAHPDGGIYGKGLANYNTSLALVAMVSANDPKFTPTIQAARQFIIGQQANGLADPAMNGGMGYGPLGSGRQHPDMSNTVVALDALHRSKSVSGQESKDAKDLNWGAAIEFLQRCQNLPSQNKEPWASDDPENKGGFVYFPGESMAGETQLADGRKVLRSYGSMSYAGLLSYIYADLKKDDPRVQAVVDWLSKHYTVEQNPGMGADGLFYYYQMMAKAFAAYGVREFTLADGRKVDWRKDIALKLIDAQKADGSWTNESGRWMEKDPVLVTSYAVLTLEMIYRAM